MPATQSFINLFKTDQSTNSSWNKFVTWIGTYGRYILISTELIVLGAFLSRFSLDRKLTDLKEEITQKQEVLEINAPLEKEIRTIQEKTNIIKTLLADQAVSVNTLHSFHMLLPSTVYIDLLSIDKNKITTNITASTTQGLSLLLGNLNATKKFSNIEIGNIDKEPTGIKLTLTGLYTTGETKKTQTK